jgi:hypothetical protein
MCVFKPEKAEGWQILTERHCIKFYEDRFTGSGVGTSRETSGMTPVTSSGHLCSQRTGKKVLSLLDLGFLSRRVVRYMRFVGV